MLDETACVTASMLFLLEMDMTELMAVHRSKPAPAMTRGATLLSRDGLGEVWIWVQVGFSSWVERTFSMTGSRTSRAWRTFVIWSIWI